MRWLGPLTWNSRDWRCDCSDWKMPASMSRPLWPTDTEWWRNSWEQNTTTRSTTLMSCIWLRASQRNSRPLPRKRIVEISGSGQKVLSTTATGLLSLVETTEIWRSRSGHPWWSMLPMNMNNEHDNCQHGELNVVRLWPREGSRAHKLFKEVVFYWKMYSNCHLYTKLAA